LKFLLDASAMLPLVTRSGRRLIVDAARVDLITTDLAIYEACNGLWKLATLLKTISLQDAQEIIALLSELKIKNLIQTISFNVIDLHSTFSLAHANRITFYDASYILAAQKANLVLVTEDQKLCKLAKDYVKTSRLCDLQKEFFNP
jgi:predicted nucleic acid-binding protein